MVTFQHAVSAPTRFAGSSPGPRWSSPLLSYINPVVGGVKLDVQSSCSHPNTSKPLSFH